MPQISKNRTNITPSFTISYPAIDASETAFGSVGTYSIPASLIGNGYFVFEYSIRMCEKLLTDIDKENISNYICIEFDNMI